MERKPKNLGEEGPIEKSRNHASYKSYWVCQWCPLAGDSSYAKDGRRHCNDNTIAECSQITSDITYKRNAKHITVHHLDGSSVTSPMPKKDQD